VVLTGASCREMMRCDVAIRPLLEPETTRDRAEGSYCRVIQRIADIDSRT
jgi:hypothetical protein